MIYSTKAAVQAPHSFLPFRVFCFRPTVFAALSSSQVGGSALLSHIMTLCAQDAHACVCCVWKRVRVWLNKWKVIEEPKPLQRRFCLLCRSRRAQGLFKAWHVHTGQRPGRAGAWQGTTSTVRTDSYISYKQRTWTFCSLFILICNKIGGIFCMQPKFTKSIWTLQTAIVDGAKVE